MNSRSHAGRRAAFLRLAGRDARFDACLVTRPVDVSYLTGFTGEDSAALVERGACALITDFRFQEQAPAECPGCEIRVRPATRSLEEEVAALARERRLRSIAVQAGHMTVAQHALLRKHLGRRRIVPLEDILPAVRRVKDEEEIRITRKAVRIAEKAFRKLIAGGARALAGKTERRIAAELEYNMRLFGADGPSFDMIVAAGANGSMCHYRPAARKVRRGEPLLIDWGAEVDGYRSDITRTLFLGEPSEKMREIYSVVLAAHDAGVAAIRPGVRCRTVDRAARDVIARAGYGAEFGHSLGHGIGREIHEEPRLSPKGNGALRRNMIVTVEPGIYLPGVGGVRIEDDILVTAEGNERLNALPRSLARMILR